MQKIWPFLAGILITLLVFLGIKHFWPVQDKTVSDYKLLTNQISKMNKMVVMEQNLSTFQKNKVSVELFGSKISENEIITLTKTNAQVSYDLNKMKIDVDTVQKKLVITELPQPDLRIIPSVEIKSVDDSFLNRIDDAQIKKITAESKANAEKAVDKNYLYSEGNKQLHKNLEQIFVLAKALHYTIEDKTNTFSKEKL